MNDPMQTPTSTHSASHGPTKRTHRGIIYLMTFIMGSCGIAYEYTFSKLSSDLMGNSVRQWAVTIGLMMFFMGIGSDVQKYLKDRGLFDKFILFEIVLGLVGGFGPIVLLQVFGALRDHYVVFQYAFTIAVGFLIGLEIPILTRLNEAYTPQLRVNVGGVLRMDYIGAFIGALAWVFVLPLMFSLTQMGFVLGLLNLLTAGLALWYFYHLSVQKALLTGFLAASVLFLSVGLGWAPVWTRQAEQRLYLDRIIFSHTTTYQHIVLTQSHSKEIYCYINGNTQFSSVDEFIYHEFLVHPAMLIAPRRTHVLVLGGGDGLAVREILKYDDVQSVTVVDIDPEMTRLARDNPILAELNHHSLRSAKVKIVDNHALIDAGTQTIYTQDQTHLFQGEYEPVAEVSLVHLDAVAFVDQVQGHYDVIILDFPDPNNLELAKLYSKGFYMNVADKLSKYGIIVQQSTSPIHAKQAFLCIGRTLQAAGFHAVPYHENVPVFGEWGWWLAGKADATSVDELKHKLTGISEIPVAVKYLTPELISASLVFGKGGLDTAETEINTIINNAIYGYYRDALTEAY